MADFNEILKNGTKTIGEIASQFSSSQYFKNIVPGAEAFGAELSATLASNRKINAAYIEQNLQHRVLSVTEDMFRRFNPSVANDEATFRAIKSEISTALEGTDYSEEALDKLSEIMKRNSIDDKKFEKFKEIALDGIDEIFKKNSNPVITPTIKEGMAHPLWYGSTYFNHPDKAIKEQRIAAVAGAYAGVSVGTRLLSGGSITHDEYGQRDIAGIPFI